MVADAQLNADRRIEVLNELADAEQVSVESELKGAVGLVRERLGADLAERARLLELRRDGKVACTFVLCPLSCFFQALQVSVAEMRCCVSTRCCATDATGGACWHAGVAPQRRRRGRGVFGSCGARRGLCPRRQRSRCRGRWGHRLRAWAARRRPAACSVACEYAP